MTKNFGVLARKSLALFLSTVLATQPFLAHGAELTADINAGQQPGITTSHNGVPLVDIVAPNASGLSHNKYSDFNVGEQGLILNNSVGGSSQSALGGLVIQNVNLDNSTPARVILNEVTGAGRSALEGMIEVNGAAADVIIANPNGLTCNGCGFLNIPHVTLSTGKPEFGDDLGLKALTVRGGDITIGAKGAALGSVDVFDIVSRKISVNGPVSGGRDLNLIAGSNRYYYGSGDVEALPGDGQEPEIAIDSSALGGMHAGRIKIISNDKGSGVNMQGQLAANAGALSLSADGKLTLRSAKASEDISVRSRSSSIRIQDTVFSDKAIVLHGQTLVELNDDAVLYARGDVTLGGKTITFGKGAAAGAGSDGDANLTGDGKLTATADILRARDARLGAGKLLSLVANEIDIVSSNQSAWTTLLSRGDIEITANTVQAANSTSNANGKITISSAQPLKLDLGAYRAGGLLSIEATSIETNADLFGHQGIAVRATEGDLQNSGKITSGADARLSSAAKIVNSGQVMSSGAIQLKAAADINNNANAIISGKKSVEATSDRFINWGTLGSTGGNIKVFGRGELHNLGLMQAKTDADLESVTAFESSGTIVAGGAARVTASQGSIGHNGHMYAQSIDLKANRLENSGHFIATKQIVANIKGHGNHHGTISASDVLLNLNGLDSYGRIFGSNSVEVKGDNEGFSGDIALSKGAVINGANRLQIAAHSLFNSGSIGSAKGSLEIRARANITNVEGLFFSNTDSLYLLGGELNNLRGDLLSEQAMTIKGLYGPRIAYLGNDSGTIEAVRGDLHIGSEKVINKRGPLVVSASSSTDTQSIAAPPKKHVWTRTSDDGDGPVYRPDRHTPQETAKTITTVTTRESGGVSGAPGKILAGGSLTLNAGEITNNYGQIAANGAVSIQAGTVLNEGRDLLETVETTTVRHFAGRYCRTRALGMCFKKRWHTWDETEHDRKVSTIGSIYGTIEAGEGLNVGVKGYLRNNAVRGDVTGLQLSSGPRAMAGVAAPAEVILPALAEASAFDVSVQSILGRPAIFQAAASPDAPYLIETRSEFIDPTQYLGSDYFLDRVTMSTPDASLKRFGDGYVDFTLLRDQTFDLTGKKSPSEPLEHNKLLKADYHNALDAVVSMGLKVGEPLTVPQINDLKSNMVWLVKKEVLGQQVLAPRLYVAPSRLKATEISGAQIKAGTVDMHAAQIVNSGTISTDNELILKSDSDIVNHGGSLAADGDIALVAEQAVANLSGSVAGENLSIHADTVVNSTLKTRDSYANGFVDRVHETAELKAKGELVVAAENAVISEGGKFAAGGDATITSGASIELTALDVAKAREDNFAHGYSRDASLTHEPSEIEAGGDVAVAAGTDLTLRGAKIVAGDDVDLVAGGTVELSAVQDAESRDLKIDIKSGGIFGTETNIREQYSDSETDAVSIAAGGAVDIIAKTGDAELEATKIESGSATTIVAEHGNVVLDATADQSFAQSFKREEDLFWWNQRDQGSSETKIRNVEIEAGGGLKIVADEGITLEYTKSGSLDASLEQLASAPGLSWIMDLRNDPAFEGKVNWQGVEGQFENWDYKTQGLTEAGAALVTLLAAVATGPATGIAANLSSGTASALGVTGNVAMESAIKAGVNSLIGKSAVALVNNKGDLGAALKDLGSSASLRSLAANMVTAGLVTHATNALDIPQVAPRATLAQNISAAAQRGVIEATIRVGAEAAIRGVSFDQALSASFRTSATAAVGSVLTTEIGDIAAQNGLKDGDVTKVILHAVAGCAAATAGAQDCIAGAIGGGLSELAGKPIAGVIENKQQQTDVIKLIAGTAAALTRRTGSAVETAADAAANAHVFNYLSHEEMVEKLGALHALAKCDKAPVQCSSEERDVLTQKISRLDATDLLRDAELKLTCSQGSIARCVQFVGASNQALGSYRSAELAAQSLGLSEQDYIASLGGKDAATAFIDAYESIVQVRGEARSSLIERTAQENPVFSQLVGAGAGEALELIGKGEDPLSKGISAGVEKAVQISSANFPQTTEAVLSALEGVSDTIDAVVTYTDDATGNVVSANWNSLDPTLRNQLKGTGKTVTVLVPFAKIKTIVEGAKIVEAGKVGQAVAKVDARSNIVKVDNTRANRGTPEYEILNNPPVNTQVEISNGTTFKTNSGGYVEEIIYHPINSPGIRDGRQTAVGKEGIAGDVGGHIQACRHGGTCDRFNLFPQNSNFNSSAYRSWENEITRSLQDGANVGGITVRFERANPNNPRPNLVEIEYSINGQVKVVQFENTIGGGL